MLDGIFFCHTYRQLMVNGNGETTPCKAGITWEGTVSMKRLLQRWYHTPIRVKSAFLMGNLLIVTWLLVMFVTLQLHEFSSASSIIMNDYIDITGFLDAFSAENVALEAYIRPISTEQTREEYLSAIGETDRWLEELRPDKTADRRKEYMLKQAICNAMEYYRRSQADFLELGREEDLIPPYLSLKTQSAYIDGYTRDLLHGRIVQGGEQWHEIEAANWRNSRRFVGFLVTTTVVVMLILLAFNRSIFRPLMDLGWAADQIREGCYDAPPLTVRSGDEIGRTAQSFNLMQKEIRRTIRALEQQAEMEKHLLEKEVETAQMQRKLQEVRFAQLQSQIKPHFLFNTLSTIAALAREEGAPLSENLILRLSSFFRYSLESGEAIVTLGRELQLLQDYIELQETRYGDRIIFEVIADPELNGTRIPKFILQPLVENSIVHGLKERPGYGRVRIRTRRTRRGITITVTDNGSGFLPGGPRPAGEQRQSVGLENISERIRLNGGRVDVFSMTGLGTSVRILMGGGSIDQDFSGGG